MRRLIENIKYTDIRIEPSGIWNRYSNIFTKSFGELKGSDLIEKLYVSNRIRSSDEFWLLSHLLELSIDDTKLLYSDFSSLSKTDLTIHRNPILIKGREGTGKSTYLRYHLNFISNKKLGLKILPIYVDYKIGPPGISNILKFSIDRTFEKMVKFLNRYHQVESIFSQEQIRDEILKGQYVIYENLFDRLEKSGNEKETFELKQKIFENLYADKGALNRLLADYIQIHLGFKIILISDNLDHHLDENYISKVIEVSMFEKASYNVNLIICVRDYNYGIAAKSRLRAFDYHVFTLTAPDLGDILAKRVSYVLDNVNGLKSNFQSEETKDKIEFLLEETESKILGDFAGDNIRLLLASAKRILSSGHLKFYKDSNSNKFKIELHDFLKSLMLGDRLYFMPPEFDTQSEVINLFENGNPVSYGNNLIRLRILQVMHNEGQFIERRKVFANMQLLGYDLTEVDNTIKNLTNYDLIESSEVGRGNRSLRFVTFTEKGKYHLFNLINEITYYDEIRSAVYFDDSSYKQILKSKISQVKTTVNERMNEIDQFIDYLISKEKVEKSYVRNHIKALELYNNITLFSSIADRLKNQIRTIRESTTANK